MTEDRLVTATFLPLIRIGAVLSSAQSDPQSFLRFYNSGSTGDTVTVTLSDSASGGALATWTSPRIEAGAAQQFALATIEAAASGFAKPRTYSLQIAPRFSGAFQHVVWDAARGLLTNQSTCNAGVGTLGRRVTHVHSSAIGDAGYAASIVVYNTGTSAASTVRAAKGRASIAATGEAARSDCGVAGIAALWRAAALGAAGLQPAGSCMPSAVRTSESLSGWFGLRRIHGCDTDRTARSRSGGNVLGDAAAL